MVHVIPINDKVVHRADCECCNAYLDPDGIWIHHSADKREQYERQGNVGEGWVLMWEDETTRTLTPLDA